MKSGSTLGSSKPGVSVAFQSHTSYCQYSKFGQMRRLALKVPAVPYCAVNGEWLSNHNTILYRTVQVLQDTAQPKRQPIGRCGSLKIS